MNFRLKTLKYTFLKKMSLSFFFILGIGLFLRLYKIGFQSFWYEELMTINYAHGDSVLHFFQRYYQTPDASPPLYSLIVHLIQRVGFNSEWSLRLPSAIFGMGIVIMTFFLGERLINKTAGIFAAACCATSGALVYYSQELRYNSCLVFFILTFTYLFLNYYEGRGGKKNERLLIANIIALTFLHYIGILFILEMIVFAVILRLNNRKMRWRLIGIVFFIILIFLPWIQVFLKQLNTWSIAKPINSSPNVWTYFIAMVKYAFFYETYWEKAQVNYREVIGWIKVIFYSFFFICFAIYARDFQKRRKEGDKKPVTLHQMILWLMFAGNIGLVFIADIIGKNRYFYEKNLLFTLPFAYLLIAYLVTKIFTARETLIIGFSLSALFIFDSFISQNYYGNSFKTEFRQTADFLSSAEEKKPILVMCGDKRWYKYYFEQYNISNVVYVDSEKQFHEFIATNDQAWLTFNHCFMNVLIEDELENYQILKKYSSNTLSFARLYKFR